MQKKLDSTPAPPALTSWTSEVLGKGAWPQPRSGSGKWQWDATAGPAPRLALSQYSVGVGAGISYPEALGLDTMGVISHHQGVRTTVGALCLAAGFPGLSCVKPISVEAPVLVFSRTETLPPASYPSVTVGQLPFIPILSMYWLNWHSWW